MGSIADEILKVTAERPRRPALHYDGRVVRRGELAERIACAAGALRAAGVGRGGRVVLMLSNRPEFVEASLGTLALGAQVVPLNVRLAEEEVEFIIRDCAADVLLVERGTRHASRVAAGSGTRVFDVDGGDSGEDWRPSLSRAPRVAPVETSEDEVALLSYTSGTTGRPKGVRLTHGNLLSNVRSCLRVMPLKPRENFLCVLPLAHVFPFTVCMLLPLAAGVAVTLVPGVRPFSRVMKALIGSRVTVFVGVPQIYRAMADAPRPSFVRRLLFRLLCRLRFAISGAEALCPQVQRRFERRFGVPLLEGYGLTEAAPVVCFTPLDGPRKPGSVGPPLPGVEVRVVDDRGEALPPGEVGELAVRGPNVMAGYLDRPEETARALRNGWLHTGDLATLDADGCVRIVGRKKEMISIKGLKVYPPEVERALMLLPGVSECAVVGLSDDAGGETVAAAVVPKEDVAVTESDLKARLKKRLADYKVPKVIKFMRGLPKTATAKVRKHLLREILAGERLEEEHDE